MSDTEWDTVEGRVRQARGLGAGEAVALNSDTTMRGASLMPPPPGHSREQLRAPAGLRRMHDLKRADVVFAIHMAIIIAAVVAFVVDPDGRAFAVLVAVESVAIVCYLGTLWHDGLGGR